MLTGNNGEKLRDKLNPIPVFSDWYNEKTRLKRIIITNPAENPVAKFKIKLLDEILS